MKVLLTGGSGFIGSHIAEQLASAGHQVRALVRKSSKVSFLEGLPGVELAHGAVDDAASLGAACVGVDAVIHAAGLVKARTDDEFTRVNVEGTRNVLAAAERHAPGLRRFVLVSSQAATAPSHDGRPVANDVTPAPVTAYGRSKLEAEGVAKGFAARVPVTIIRPPAVYGPRDTEMYQLFVSANRRVLPFIGDPDGRLSLIYGPDCARACILALTAEVPSGSAFFVTDGRVYTRREMMRGLEVAVGKRALVSFPLPTGVVRGVALLSEAYGRVSKRAVMLTRHKLDELLGEWICDGSDAERALGFAPTTYWTQGASTTAAWYREQRWL